VREPLIRFLGMSLRDASCVCRSMSMSQSAGCAKISSLGKDLCSALCPLALACRARLSGKPGTRKAYVCVILEGACLLFCEFICPRVFDNSVLTRSVRRL
jgi:hypothetical protein